MKGSKQNLRILRPFAPTNTSQSASAKAPTDSTARSAANSMLKDASIPAFISTWETASTDSTASSLTPSRDKSSSQNPTKTSAKNYITRTIVPKETNAAFPTTFEKSPASSTPSTNASFPKESVGFPTPRKWR